MKGKALLRGGKEAACAAGGVGGVGGAHTVGGGHSASSSPARRSLASLHLAPASRFETLQAATLQVQEPSGSYAFAERTFHPSKNQRLLFLSRQELLEAITSFPVTTPIILPVKPP